MNAEMKLEALVLPNGKAETVQHGITCILDEYNPWTCIKVIVTDTNNVNTERKNGAVIQLQRLFAQNKLEVPDHVLTECFAYLWITN